MNKNQRQAARRRAHQNANQKHNCFCGRTLHNHHDWQQHKKTCPSWSHGKETK